MTNLVITNKQNPGIMTDTTKEKKKFPNQDHDIFHHCLVNSERSSFQALEKLITFVILLILP